MLRSKGALSLETTSSSPRNIIERGGREDEDHDSAPSEKEEDESSEDDRQLTDEDKEMDGSQMRNKVRHSATFHCHG